MKEDWQKLYYLVFPEERGAWPKAQILYGLALKATGPIVEVGAAQGRGTVALAFGSRDGPGVPVYAIEPFVPFHGWVGEYYGPEMKDIWAASVAAAGVDDLVTLVQKPIGEALAGWDIEAGLTFWDIGRRLVGEQDDWLLSWCQDCVMEGGIVALDETGNHDLGVDEWLERHPGILNLEAIAHGFIRITRKLHG
jgi:hypothetical protein